MTAPRRCLQSEQCCGFNWHYMKEYALAHVVEFHRGEKPFVPRLVFADRNRPEPGRLRV
jgi:hypothetical protein